MFDNITYYRLVMPISKIRLILKVVCDVILLCLVALPVLIFYAVGTPFGRGFFCNDESIQYPYRDSTVTSLTLYLIGTLLPLIFILGVEYYNAFYGSQLSRKVCATTYFWTIYCYIGSFLFGCAASHTIVDICKYTVGRLRPHFISVCKPDLSMTNCAAHPYAYVSYDMTKCTGVETETKMRETRLSFMSGHSSFSTYTMVFLILYLQARFHTRFSLVKPILQHICFIIAIFTCLSRVQDYKHHWSDVFAGFVNGLIFGVLVAVGVAKLFRKGGPKDLTEFNLQENNRTELTPTFLNRTQQP